MAANIFHIGKQEENFKRFKNEGPLIFVFNDAQTLLLKHKVKGHPFGTASYFY